MADMVVSGAGTSAVNGTYAENGTKFEKPRYRMASAQSVTGYFYVVWSGPANRWCISVQGDDSVAYSQILGGSRYMSTDNVATPDLCTTWVIGSGANPVPTVTAAGGGDASGALRRTNMNAQMSNLTGGMHG